jgi:hypothetical protein
MKIKYALSPQEIEEGYSEKSWDGETYLVEFEHDWNCSRDTLKINEKDIKNIERIMTENDRIFKITPDIHLWY